MKRSVFVVGPDGIVAFVDRKVVGATFVSADKLARARGAVDADGRPRRRSTFIRSRTITAMMATTRADGRAAMSPIACDVDADGAWWSRARETAMKVKHLQRDPHVAICVLNDGFFGEWVQVEGDRRDRAPPEAMDGLVDYYRRVSGEHPDWDDYRAAMERERRVLLRITSPNASRPERVGLTRTAR